MDTSLIATLLAAAGAATVAFRRNDGEPGQLEFISRNWGDIARAMRERGTSDAMIERFRSDLFAAR